MNHAFLAAALGELGIWDDIATTNGPSGRSLQATMAKAQTQAKVTGALADVGEFDAEEAERLLPGTAGAKAAMSFQHRGDDSAEKIFDRIRSAAPDARGPILRQLAAMNRLDFLCQHLPWQQVKAIHDAVVPFDRGAAVLVAPYFEGKGGGESMHQIYMDKVDDRLKAGHEVRAFGWFLLDFLHNAATAGFEHEYSASYDAHEQGWITDDEHSSQTTKALGKAALITAVSAVTGGLVGEWAQGLAAPLGEGAAGVVGGGVGGFAAGVSGHFAGDVYDQLLSGKKRFDSLGDYMTSGALAGGMGASAAMLGSLSIGGARYLRPDAVDGSLKRTGDLYAERHPAMTRILEAARRAGVNQRVTIQAKVSEVLELIDSHLGGPGGPSALAVAGGGSLRSLPEDADVRLSFRPAEDLNRPVMMSGKKSGPENESNGRISATPLQIDSIESSTEELSQSVASGEEGTDRGARVGGTRSGGHEQESKLAAAQRDAHGPANRPASDIPRVTVPRSKLSIGDRVTSKEWTFSIDAQLENGEKALVAYGTAEVDAGGQPVGGPSFYFDKDFELGGVKYRIAILDDANGKPLSLTDLALDEAMKRFEMRYGRAPDELPGYLIGDNRVNFQREYLKGLDRGLTAEVAKVDAVSQISFGRARASRGYDQFTVETAGEETIMFGDPPRPRNVPHKIDIVAKRNSHARSKSPTAD